MSPISSFKDVNLRRRDLKGTKKVVLASPHLSAKLYILRHTAKDSYVCNLTSYDLTTRTLSVRGASPPLG